MSSEEQVKIVLNRHIVCHLKDGLFPSEIIAFGSLCHICCKVLTTMLGLLKVELLKFRQQSISPLKLRTVIVEV